MGLETWQLVREGVFTISGIAVFRPDHIYLMQPKQHTKLQPKKTHGFIVFDKFLSNLSNESALRNKNTPFTNLHQNI